MYKKLLSILLALGIALSLSACSPAAFSLLGTLMQELQTIYTQVEACDYSLQEGYTYKQYSFGYDALDQEEQAVYKQIEQAVYRIGQEKNTEIAGYPIEKIKTAASFSEVRFYKVTTAFGIDMPQIFWLNGVYTFQDYGDNRYFQIYSYLSAEECDKAQTLFYQEVNKIVSSVPKGLSEYERELFLHDYIVGACTYVEDKQWERYSPYGAIVEKQAVCEGYSEALQLLFNCVGLESAVLFGEYEGEAHEWNIIQLAGNWYHLDATWNDMDEESTGEDILEADKYVYFNLNDAGITENDHEISSLYAEMTEAQILPENEEYIELFNLFVPTCDSLEQNFFYQNGAFITTVDGVLEGQPIQNIKERAARKESEIYLIIDEAISMQEADDALFDREPYLYFSYLTASNMEPGLNNKLIEDETTTYSMFGYDRLIVAELLYQ